MKRLHARGFTAGLLAVVSILTLDMAHAAVPYTPTPTNTWIGASGADWSAESSWSLGRAPKSGEKIFTRFTTAARVTPPDAWTGTVYVAENVAVTADVPVSAAITLRLSDTTSGTPSLTKTGAGKLSLKAYRGINTGTVRIVAGSVDLVGYGELEAPGVFDKIEILGSVQAKVIESPFATRHGLAVLAGYQSFAASCLPEGFGGFSNNGEAPYYYFAGGTTGGPGNEVGNLSQTPAQRQEYIWDSHFSLTTEVAQCFVATATKPALYQNNSVPSGVLTFQTPYVTFSRGILMVETGSTIYWRTQNGPGGGAHACWVIDDGSKYLAQCTWNATLTNAVSISRGLHALNSSVWSTTSYNWKSNWSTFYRDPINALDLGTCTEDVLWFGVGCNTLTLDENATLTVGSGQALALANVDTLDIRGRILAESSTSCVTLFSTVPSGTSSDSSWTSVTGFGSYSGLLEIGRAAKLKLASDDLPSAARLFGRGSLRIPNGYEGRFAADWHGRLDIPANVSFDATACSGAPTNFTGTGTIVLSSAQVKAYSLGCFEGTIRTTSGAVDELAKFETGSQTSVELGDGTYTYETPSLASSAGRSTAEIPAPTNTIAWSFFGKSYTPTIKAPDGTAFSEDADSRPKIEDGKLVLTWSSHHQRHAAFLTSHPFTVQDRFRMAFTVAAFIPKSTTEGEVPPYAGVHGWRYDVRSGVLRLGFTGVAPGTVESGRSPGYFPSGSQSLYWYFYRQTQLAPAPYYGQTSEGGRLTGPNGEQIDPTKPWNMVLEGAKGFVTVTISQGAVSYSVPWDIHGLLDKYGAVTFGFGGNSDYWSNGNVSVPWIRLEISDFEGSVSSVMKLPYESTTDAKEEMRLTADNWVCNSSNIGISDDGVLTLTPKGVGTYAQYSAVCKTPFKPQQAFRMEYDIVQEKSASSGTATLCGLFLETEGTSPTITKSGNGFGAISTKNSTCWGYFTQTYASYLASTYGSGTTTTGWLRTGDQTVSMKAGATNHVTVCYDGAGTMYVSYASSKTVSQTYTYPGLADGSQDLYLMLTAATTWAAVGKIEISNLEFHLEPGALVTPPAAYQPSLTVADDAAVTLATGSVEVPAASEQVTYQDLTLGSGSTLTLKPVGQATSVGLGTTTVEGAAQIVVADATTARIGNLAFTGATPCVLTVTGAVTLSPTMKVAVPATWKSQLSQSYATVLDLTGATVSGALSDVVTVTDLEGVKVRSPKCEWRGNTLVLYRPGFSVIVK